MDSTGMPLESGKHLSELEALRQENEALKAKLKEKERTIDDLTQERDELQSRVDELRQLPTGKISQIPIEYVPQSYGEFWFPLRRMNPF